MAPDPPRIGSECLSSVNSELLVMAVNSDDSDDNDDIDNNNDITSLGYTLFTSTYDMMNSNGVESEDDDDDDEESFDNGIDHVDGVFNNSDNIGFDHSTELRAEFDHPGTSQSSSVLCDNRSSSLDGVIHDQYITLVQQQNRSVEENDMHDANCSLRIANDARSDITINCDQVKAAMIGFTLPPSAIPEWAKGISDQDIAGYVNRLLLKNSGSERI
ncbi:uncharacterized protein LOC142326744 isoform X2 [Lycorma delicatula]|uniref:uncharacterized protein LOC142326744 isoform X2 n=1 Tax=Lycorma delicatula TaxID=130591 RepID=UPI003F515778